MTLTAEKKVTYGKDVFEAYVNQESYAGRNYSTETVYFIGDTIYSYGGHFPMAKRMEGGWYLVNGDRYSPTTDKHQSYLRNALSYENTVIIPFSALEQATIEVDSIRLIDKQEETYISKTRKDPDTGDLLEYQVHLLGASLIEASYRVWDMEESISKTNFGYFLAGLDETGKNPHTSFFLAQLDPMCFRHTSDILTVEDGYTNLKPNEVLEAELEDDVHVERQGEFFFVECSPEKQQYFKELERKMEKEMKKSGEPSITHTGICYERNGFLSNRDTSREMNHRATRMVTITLEGEHTGSTETYVRGTVRHIGGDHRLLKLENGWYQVYENTQLRGWKIDGSVD